jgi:hypothetical protein
MAEAAAVVARKDMAQHDVSERVFVHEIPVD